MIFSYYIIVMKIKHHQRFSICGLEKVPLNNTEVLLFSPVLFNTSK